MSNPIHELRNTAGALKTWNDNEYSPALKLCSDITTLPIGTKRYECAVAALPGVLGGLSGASRWLQVKYPKVYDSIERDQDRLLFHGEGTDRFPGWHSMAAEIAESWFHFASLIEQVESERVTPEQLHAAVERVLRDRERQSGAGESRLLSKQGLAVGMTWQEAKKKAERHVSSNGYPGLNALARIVGCSAATMTKAIKGSTKLKSAKAQHEADGKKACETTLTQAVLDQKPQSTEPDPQLQALIAEQAAEEGQDRRKAKRKRQDA